MIHASAQKYITQIARQSSRVLRVTLDRYRSKMPIHILSNYAPHNGHSEADRIQHWGEVKEIHNQTCKRHMIIWRADANGQLGRDKGGENEKSPNENTAHNKIGPYKREKTEKGTRNIPCENMTNTTDDTGGNLEGAAKERQDACKI